MKFDLIWNSRFHLFSIFCILPPGTPKIPYKCFLQMMGLKLLFNNLLSLVKRTLSIHFRPVFHFPWKRLPDVFWGYRNGTLDKKGLKTFIKEQKQKTLILEAYLGPCQTSKIYERVLNTPLNSICLSSQLLLTVSQVLTPNV